MTAPLLSVAEIRELVARSRPERLARLLSRFDEDPRQGVADCVAVARRRLAAFRTESRRLDRMAAMQSDLEARGIRVVAGLDEVGRGSLAGPVSAAAVILPVSCRIERIDDSKRLTPEVRRRLDLEIRAVAVDVAVAHVSPGRIDEIGIARAVEQAMREAIASLATTIDHALVDGRVGGLGVPTTAIVKGDSSVAAIAAASIVAKVARDALMVLLDEDHPGYGLASNKGYGSPDHLAAIDRLGPSAVHRRSFSPCSQTRLF